MYKSSSFSALTEVIKNLLIINGLLFFATISLENYGINLTQIFGLHQFQSSNFMPHQLITHFFMHGSFSHLFFNMFALWMFGKTLEKIWGAKRFLIYYLITAIGAAILHLIVSQYQILYLSNNNPEILDLAKQGLYNVGNSDSLRLTQLVNTPTVGASGAVFGILLAFGMLFPNTLLYIYFALPIKAKYFVILYGILELYLGLSNNPADNVAHFAHLGGMIFGFFLIKYWQKNRNTFY
tara:strand:+ start:6225 stop:6938 length:714 start_codon:yes stop_codon:yes gene_type:complete